MGVVEQTFSGADMAAVERVRESIRQEAAREDLTRRMRTYLYAVAAEWDLTVEEVAADEATCDVLQLIEPDDVPAVKWALDDERAEYRFMASQGESIETREIQELDEMCAALDAVPCRVPASTRLRSILLEAVWRSAGGAAPRSDWPGIHAEDVDERRRAISAMQAWLRVAARI